MRLGRLRAQPPNCRGDDLIGVFYLWKNNGVEEFLLD